MRGRVGQGPWLGLWQRAVQHPRQSVIENVGRLKGTVSLRMKLQAIRKNSEKVDRARGKV